MFRLLKGELSREIKREGFLSSKDLYYNNFCVQINRR